MVNPWDMIFIHCCSAVSDSIHVTAERLFSRVRAKYEVRYKLLFSRLSWEILTRCRTLKLGHQVGIY